MARIACIVGTCLILGGFAAAQQPEMTTHPVNGNIYMLEGRGGNIGVSAGEDGILIIDDQFPNMVPLIREELAALDKGELKFILNTHFHGDHTGGNQLLGADATIIAHDNVRKRLAEGKDLGDVEVRQGLPTITFDESVSIHFNGEEIRAIHYPNGHTDTDSVIFFTESNVVHMGDHFFNGRFPFVDLAHGGDVAGYIENVRAILEEVPDDVHIIPGHGPLATKADFETFLAGLEDTVAIVREGMEAGKDIETLREEGLPGKYDEWGEGFISTPRWISTIYRSFEGQ